MRYLVFTKAGLLSVFMYRTSAISTSITNLLYVVIIFFLWSAIYDGSGGVIKGVSFHQAFVYLALASTFLSIYSTGTDWKVSGTIVSGNIINQLIKPTDYQLMLFFHSMAQVVYLLFWVGTPVILLISAVGGLDVIVVERLPLFLLSLCLAYGISFHIDYLVGVTAFHTQSIWGLISIKESLILVLSGAVVPLVFFPESFQSVLAFTPFAYIYNTPLILLTDATVPLSRCIEYLAIQLAWGLALFSLARGYFHVSIQRLIINGG